ncbi:hypothetical protein AGMMS4957_13520 [Bacteroidia bacterium]|nr:hypothetical protein AGMMS4957_13520 [Bacteroidia bacterium]
MKLNNKTYNPDTPLHVLNGINLELRFEAGEDMGDFMDGATARVIKPPHSLENAVNLMADEYRRNKELTEFTQLDDAAFYGGA